MSLPPGPSLPAAMQTMAFLLEPMAWAQRVQARYGDVYTVKNAVFGTQVILGDPELIRQVFTGDPDVFHAGEANQSLGIVVGDRSLLLLDGAEHIRHRRLMLPPFHGERMHAYAETMRSITDRAVDGWAPGAAFSLHPTMQQITLDIILRTVFGLELGARHDELSTRLTTLFNRLQSRFGMLMMIPALQVDVGPLTPWAAFKRERSLADALLYAEIADRRAELASAGAKPRRNDVLTMLLEARDEHGQGLEDHELRDELMTLLAAGHETTATALCWAFERILNHPEVERKLLAELDAVAPKRAVTGEDLPRLEYLEATIKEVMRMRPVITGVARRLKAPIKIRGWDIPPGTVIVPSIHQVHHRADLYPDPQRFYPERFLGKKTDPYSYFPFGGGVRRCIGMAFALYEMKTVLAAVLRRARLRLAERRALGVELRSFVFAPEGGTRVVLDQRLPALAVATQQAQPEA
jgi:cytochrome P450